MICLFSREGGTCWILDSGRGICGNGVVEVWEECDCGLDPDICEEQCCIPPGDKLGRSPCKLTPGVQCSPSEGNLKVVWGNNISRELFTSLLFQLHVRFSKVPLKPLPNQVLE